MLEAHETQLVWLRDHDGVDIVEEMKTAARYRGQQCGAPLRRGVHPVPHVAARHDDEAVAVEDREEKMMPTTPGNTTSREFISFRDREACERVRAIARADLAPHSNPEVQDRHRRPGRGLLPGVRRRHRRLHPHRRATRRARSSASSRSGRCRNTRIAARTINEERLSLAHVHTFNMDEYADEDGNTAPLSWAGSFQRAMWERSSA